LEELDIRPPPYQEKTGPKRTAGTEDFPGNGRLRVQGTDTVAESVRGKMAPGVRRSPSFTSRRARPAHYRAGLLVLLLALQQPHVGGLGALRALRDVELDGLSLSK
jgi:hypothetical protein